MLLFLIDEEEEASSSTKEEESRQKEKKRSPKRNEECSSSRRGKKPIIISANENEACSRVGERYQALLPEQRDKKEQCLIKVPQFQNLKLDDDGKLETINEVERNAVLLGLYVFRERWDLIEKFVGSKRKGDLLCYFHSNDFHETPKYKAWFEQEEIKKGEDELKVREKEEEDERKQRQKGKEEKKKGKKGGGKKKGKEKEEKKEVEEEQLLFKPQELLSHLSEHIDRSLMLEISGITNALECGFMSMEQYIFSLKDHVGLVQLIDAFALGTKRCVLIPPDKSQRNQGKSKRKRRKPKKKGW